MQLLAADPAHLQRVHALARRVVGHREEDDVAVAGRVVDVEEVALAPVRVVGGDVGEQLGDLVDELLVHRGGRGHGSGGADARGRA